MEREIPDYPGIGILSGYLQVASQILRHISNALSAAPSTEPQEKARQAVDALDRFSVQLREVAAATPPSFIAAVAKDAVFQMDALSGQLRAALDLSQNNVELQGVADAPSLTPRTWKETFSNIIEIFRNHLNLQSPNFRHALRLAVLVALGDILGTEVSWRRTYWLPMTIALVLKPEFTATFTRGLLRIAGTIVGLLLATVLFHLFNPGVVLQVILIFVLVFLLRWLGPANYGIFGIAVSALIVLLLAIAGVPPNDVIWARGVNTVVGGSLALLAYWLWPTWERTRVSERIAEMLDAYRNYAHALSRWNPAEIDAGVGTCAARCPKRPSEPRSFHRSPGFRARNHTRAARQVERRTSQFPPFHSCPHGSGCNFFSPTRACQLSTSEKFYVQARKDSCVALFHSSWRAGAVERLP